MAKGTDLVKKQDLMRAVTDMLIKLHIAIEDTEESSIEDTEESSIVGKCMVLPATDRLTYNTKQNNLKKWWSKGRSEDIIESSNINTN